MIEFDLFILGIVGFGLGWAVGMSGLTLTSARFLAVATIEFSIPTAVGTAIGGTTFSMIPAALNYYKTRSIHTKIFIVMTPPGVAGAILGALFISFIPSAVIIGVITVMMIYGLVSLLRNKTVKHEGVQTVLDKGQYIREGIVAFGLGWLVGMFGVLLVNVRLLSMMDKFKIGPKTVIGTSIAISCILGATSFAGHTILGNVNFLLLFVLASSGMVGGIIGAKFTNRMSQKKLKIILIILFVFIIGYLLFMLTNVLLKPSVIQCSTCF